MTTAADHRCADVAELHHESLAGTAPAAHCWLLLEHPGPWGRDAVSGSGFDPAISDQLTSVLAAMDGRVMLIRRVGSIAGPGHRRWAFVDSRPGSEAVWWGTYTKDAELRELTLPPTGHASGDRLYLVCTHGKRDPCCALRGRPVAAALAATWPEETWECSHISGHRFAANLLLLPHGLSYGQVSPGQAVTVIDSYLAGRVVTQQLRGRSAFPPQVQAAQHHVRHLIGDTSVTALHPEAITQLGTDLWQVSLAHPTGVWRLAVRSRKEDATRLMSCGSEPARPVSYEMTAVQQIESINPPGT
jgi:hypothetical protein